jgi:hypothetical protein
MYVNLRLMTGWSWLEAVSGWQPGCLRAQKEKLWHWCAIECTSDMCWRCDCDVYVVVRSWWCCGDVVKRCGAVVVVLWLWCCAGLAWAAWSGTCARWKYCQLVGGQCHFPSISQHWNSQCMCAFLGWPGGHLYIVCHGEYRWGDVMIDASFHVDEPKAMLHVFQHAFGKVG